MKPIIHLDRSSGLVAFIGWTAEVNTFADLPPAGDHDLEFYMVLQPTGSRFLFTYKASGLYRSEGGQWIKKNDVQLLLNDDQFSVYNAVDQTKVIKFDVSTIATATQRTATWQDKDGIVAYVSDIPFDQINIISSTGLVEGGVMSIQSRNISTIQGDGGTPNTVTVNTTSNHDMLTGDSVNILGTVNYDELAGPITVLSPTSFTYSTLTHTSSVLEVVGSVGDPFRLDVSAFTLWSIDRTVPTSPVLTVVAGSILGYKSVLLGASDIGIDNAGSVVQVVQLTPTQRSTITLLGPMVTLPIFGIAALLTQPQINYSTHKMLYDHVEAQGLINVSDNDYLAATPTRIQKTSGVLHGNNINYSINPEDPTNLTIPSENPLVHTTTYEDGITPGSLIIAPGQIDIDTTLWDDGSGILQTIPPNKYVNRRIYIFANNNPGQSTTIPYPQNLYNSMDEALAAIESEPFQDSPAFTRGLWVYALTYKESGDLTNPVQAQFSRIRGGNSASASAPATLQSAYDNSPVDEISLDVIRDAVTHKASSASVINTHESKDELDSLNWYVSRLGAVAIGQFTNAAMLAFVPARAGVQVFNTTWNKTYWWDGDVWLTDQMFKATNQNVAAMTEGNPVIQDGIVSNGVDMTAVAGSIAIVGVVKDVYGGGGTGQFVTVATAGEHNVLYAGAVSIGEAAIADNVNGQATAVPTGQAGIFGIARQSKGAPGTALLLTLLSPTERF